VNAQRCNDLRLTGSGGANRVMEAELKRLVMRSPFDVRLDKPKREGEEIEATGTRWDGSYG
jgi:hypothetical protein